MNNNNNNIYFRETNKFIKKKKWETNNVNIF